MMLQKKNKRKKTYSNKRTLSFCNHDTDVQVKVQFSNYAIIYNLQRPCKRFFQKKII